MRSLNTLSLISASLLHVTRGHMTQEIPSTTIPTLSFLIIKYLKTSSFLKNLEFLLYI
jgi:hypothetical protein